MKTIIKLLFLLFSITTYAQVTTLPHATDFELGFGDWTNSTFDNFDWTQTTTKTPVRIVLAFVHVYQTASTSLTARPPCSPPAAAYGRGAAPRRASPSSRP